MFAGGQNIILHDQHLKKINAKLNMAIYNKSVVKKIYPQGKKDFCFV